MIQPTPTSEFTLELSRVIKADSATIFAAWTDPQQLTQWLKPTPEFTHGKVSCDARKEGEYEIEFISPDDTHHLVNGTYTRFDPPQGLSFTWTWQNGNPDHQGIDTIVHIDLKRIPDGTELTLRHEGHKDDEMKQSHGHGWGGALEQLATLHDQ
ncbi:SRPBCC domain-containing protein [Planctomycetaceae bacterium]|nr:SRPBCC domain-containing protein [Planctomycetaceae bacterium]MDC0262359.1 SRPBCC domain-containing protein [Planctomycetaceae bacterium]MDC0307794.1 SRPBCC domain-containing protein [Planctomycetaceae bacterium]